MLVLGVDVIILLGFGFIFVMMSGVICALLKMTDEMGNAVIASSFCTAFLMICAYCFTTWFLELLSGAA